MSVERIQQLLDKAETLRVKHSEDLKHSQTAFEAEIATVWKLRFPKRKFSMKASADKVKGNQPAHGQIYEWWMKQVDTAYKEFRASLDANEKMIVEESLLTDIPAFEGMSQFEVVPSDNYRSQGFGMNKYARADAQDHEDKAKTYGLKTELREVLTYEGKDSCGYNFKYYDYEVWVSTSPVGVEILRRKPEKETMADWVAKCDARMVNPRVMFPFMTYQEEERFREQAKEEHHVDIPV